MPLKYTRDGFLSFLEKLDKKLDRHIYIIAIGGTALSLINLKEKTKDIDFFIRDINFDDFEPRLEKLLEEENISRKEVDYWEDGLILFVKGAMLESRLPPDYFNIAMDYQTNLKNIGLKVLNPVDLVITKVGRLQPLDRVDIKNLISIYKIDRTFLETRFNYFSNSFNGNKVKLAQNFNEIIKENYSD